jgi:hypothetical protein
MKKERIYKVLKKVTNHHTFDEDQSKAEIECGGRDSQLNYEINKLCNIFGSRNNKYFLYRSKNEFTENNIKIFQIILKEPTYDLFESFRWYKQPLWRILLGTILVGVIINVLSDLVAELYRLWFSHLFEIVSNFINI